MPRSLLVGADGGRSPRKPDRAQPSRKSRRSHRNVTLWTTTPSAAKRWASRKFSWCRSLPSSRGGECAYKLWSTHCQHQLQSNQSPLPICQKRF